MPCRTLTFDSGGVKVALALSFLASIEDKLDYPIASCFELIAGTSAGGIAAMGLGLGYTARELISLHRATAAATSLGGGQIHRSLKQSRYSAIRLRNAMRTVFGCHLLGDSRYRLVIPSVDLEQEQIFIFRTPHHPDYTHDANPVMHDVAMAFCAVPPYFLIHVMLNGTFYADGSLRAANPIALAVAEGLGLFGWSREDVFVLSLGCASTRSHASRRSQLDRSASQLALRYTALLQKTQSSGAVALARNLLASRRIFHIEADTNGQDISFDDVSQIARLESLGQQQALNWLPILREHFFSGLAEPFTPLRQRRHRDARSASERLLLRTGICSPHPHLCPVGETSDEKID